MSADGPDASSAVAAGRELLDSATRADLERGRVVGAPVMRRAAVIVAGARRIFDVIDVPVAGGSAGIGLDATEVETLRAEIARTVLAHRRTLDQLTTALEEWIKLWNEGARPFRWTKTADQIIDRICRYCSRISRPAH